MDRQTRQTRRTKQRTQKHRIPAQWAECGVLHYEACYGLDVLSGEATNQLDQLSNEPADHWNGGGDAHQ